MRKKYTPVSPLPLAMTDFSTIAFLRITAARARVAALGGLLLAMFASTGCVVPQPRGDGKLSHVTEPTTGRKYWMYLPKEYVDAGEGERQQKRWPLVVTFHGMKPFDNALPQALEWEQEADRYGYIVIAPELGAPDMLDQFPLRTVHPAFKRDEDCTVAILDHVFATTPADPSNVLSTSWSSGGYMAHYMLNRHPERFTCLAVRQSNFARSVLDEGMTARSQYHPVFIVNTQNDFGICVSESKDAVNWYDTHGYKNVAWVRIRRLGHERTPDTAADFFARVIGIEPMRTPEVLAKRQAIDGNAAGLAFLSGQGTLQRRPTDLVNLGEKAGGSLGRDESVARPTRPRASLLGMANADGIAVNRPPPMVAASSNEVERPPTPARGNLPQRNTPPRRPPINIRVSSAIGLEPLRLGFSAECPADWQNSADFSWTLNGETIANGVNGQKTIAKAGDHTLTLLVVTRDGQEYSASRQITVIPQIDSAAYADKK